MAHGGYDKRRVSGRKPNSGSRSKGTSGGVSKKPKNVSLKNQIRSIERMLRKNVPQEIREAQEKKLEILKKQNEIHNRLAIERKIFLRERKIKFFERRKIERRIRRLERMQRSQAAQVQEAETAEQLSKLKEDLEYVRFFPKTEKYVSLFSGGENVDLVDRRNRLRKQIKANIVAAAASGKELEETGSEDDGLIDLSDDDFFAAGSSSDEADADDELTDKSAKEQASSASGKAASGMSGDERNQRQVSARNLMPPPRPSVRNNASTSYAGESSRVKPFARKSSNSYSQRPDTSSRNASTGRGGMSSGIDRGFSHSSYPGSNSNRGFSHSNNPGSNSNRGFSHSNNPGSNINRGFSHSNHPGSNSDRGFSRSSNPGSNSDRGFSRSNNPGSNSDRGFSHSNNPGSNSDRGFSHSNNPGSNSDRGFSSSQTGQNSNLSSNSDAHKPRRKRRPKKKKQ